ncbi:uncharacterized protein DMAD_10196 [Drosophila madeirensis]|uniref:Uncharacterized protein n=1 Tax=Drosophila madeirensis TaxID=30013 RepID=A0AAU9F8P9_DROMD
MSVDMAFISNPRPQRADKFVPYVPGPSKGFFEPISSFDVRLQHLQKSSPSSPPQLQPHQYAARCCLAVAVAGAPTRSFACE